MQLGVVDLERLFGDLPKAWPLSLKEVTTLKQLEGELKYRQVPRAVALLEKVQMVLRGKDGEAARVPTAPVQPATAPELSVPTFLAPSPSQNDLFTKPPQAPTPAPAKWAATTPVVPPAA